MSAVLRRQILRSLLGPFSTGLQKSPLKPVNFARFLSYEQGQYRGKTREYFYYIDHQGMLYLDDARMKNFTSCFKDKQFLRFFFKRLKRNDTDRYLDEFPFVSPCGSEMNYIRCDDIPIVFTQVIEKSDTEEELLSYNHAGDLLTHPFRPEMISMDPLTGRVYHPAGVRSGGFGLISDKLSIKWTAEKRFEFNDGEENPPTSFEWKDRKIQLSHKILTEVTER